MKFNSKERIDIIKEEYPKRYKKNTTRRNS